MKFPFLASIIVFCIWLAYEIHKHNKKDKKFQKDFWEREAKANATRKKSLDSLNYIVIPEEILNILSGNFPEELYETKINMEHLKNSKIVNLTNISNTDLKLEYGAANIDVLSEYDQNYLLLSRSLFEIGDFYHKSNDDETAKLALEFAVSTGCDSIGVYKILTDIYNSEENYGKITYLKSSASLLSGITKGPILDYLYSSHTDTEDKDLEESIFDILE